MMLADRLQMLSSGLQRGWQADLARFCKVRPPSVADWLSGKSKTISGETLLMVAAYFKVNPMWLATGKGRRDVLDNNINLGEAASIVRVPLITVSMAGEWNVSKQEIKGDISTQWIPTTARISENAFALVVQDDSMEPKFPRGSTIIVDPAESATNGSFVIVRNEPNAITFKQLVIDGATHYLKPYNERYPIIIMAESAIIVGVIKQIVMDI